MQPTITELLVGLLALKRSELYKRKHGNGFGLDLTSGSQCQMKLKSKEHFVFDTAKMTLDTERI